MELKNCRFKEYEYAPFNSKDLIIGKIVQLRCRPDYKELIIGQSPEGISIGGRNSGQYLYWDLLQDWEFQDGSPCGKLIRVIHEEVQ